jgi:hypothetical protein
MYEVGCYWQRSKHWKNTYVNDGKFFWQHVSSTNTKSLLFYSRLKWFQHQRAKFWFTTPFESYNLSKWHVQAKARFIVFFTNTNDLHAVVNNRRKKIALWYQNYTPELYLGQIFFKVAEYTCFFPKTYIKSVLIVKFNMSRCSGKKH